MNKAVRAVWLLMVIPVYAIAQGNLTLPQSSQRATVSQRIGLTDITITYNSPLVKGRVIWGEVVPFGDVWRAGANENTVITFSTPVSVEGKNLPAGSYGLHMIPRKETWTIIFSTNYKSWGSYFYDQSEDALRVEVAPEVAPMQEWLSYRFTDVKSSSARVTLNWEKISVGFLVQVDLNQTILASMRQELRGPKFYSWEGPFAAANFCLKNDLSPEEAMKWIDQSIAVKETFSNLNVKSELLRKKGQTGEADKCKTKALALADEQQLNAYGYQLLAEGNKQGAIDIFKMNVKRYPDSWNAYDSLADAFDQNGNIKEAIGNYKTALSKAPENQKKRITNLISQLEKRK